MNSVALPASATSSPSALSAEADLVRLAARGDADAFGELHRRHSQPAWRLAQAVAPDRDGAISAFRDGFVRALSAHRRSRHEVTGTFRNSVLGAVYKASADAAAQGSNVSPDRRPAASAEAALANAAFRSLPDRWRAAVWLSEVENLDADRIAPILGVSSAVAAQLVVRGRRGLAGRFTQAHRDVPDMFGPVLRPLALALPANLAEVAQARWAVAGSERAPILAPMAAWLEDKALRPMTVAVGALLGLGLIGLGVVPQGSSVRAQLGASGAHNPGALPVQTCFGLACSTSGGIATAASLGAGSGFAAPTGGAFGGGGATTGGTSSPSTPTGVGGSGGGTPAGSGNPGTPHNPPPPPTVSTPVANATVGSGSTNVTLLPTSNGGGTVSATLNTSGSGSPVCVTAGSTSAGCSPSQPGTPSATTPTTLLPTPTTTLPALSTVEGLANSTGL